MVRFLHNGRTGQLGQAQFTRTWELPSGVSWPFFVKAAWMSSGGFGQLAIDRSSGCDLGRQVMCSERNEVGEPTNREALAAMRQVKIPWLLLPGKPRSGRTSQRLGPDREDWVPRACPLVAFHGTGPLGWRGLAVLPAPLTGSTFTDPTEGFGQQVTSQAAVRVGLAHGSLRNRLAPAAEQHNYDL